MIMSASPFLTSAGGRSPSSNMLVCLVGDLQYAAGLGVAGPQAGDWGGMRW